MKKLFTALTWDNYGDGTLIAASFDLGDVMAKIYDTSLCLSRRELAKRFATLEIYNIPVDLGNMTPRELYNHLIDDKVYADEVYEIHDFGRAKVLNDNGVIIDFISVLEFMDDDLAEELHNDLAPCNDQAFFEAYCKAHLDKYGEEFEFNKKSPCV